MVELRNIIARILLNGVNRVVPGQTRGIIASLVGITNDKNIILKKRIFFECPIKVHIGYGCLINHSVRFYTGAYNNSEVIIGNRVFIGMETRLITTSHEIGSNEQRAGNNFARSIVIEDGVWIGAGVTVLPGVRIGAGGIIAAGAVVTHSTEPNTLYVGIPAKKIKSLI